ncbi:Fc.00g050900.m01.CDS01 [Cosmosporella sp. VM-42]
MSFRTFAVRAGAAANAASCRSSRSSFGMVQQAKVLSSSLGARQLSTEATKINELPGDEANDVVFESKYGLRTIMLNRPKKLNSLNSSMIRKIVPRLIEWEKSDMANVVVMKGAGEKALCAGGDVAALAKHNQDGADGWKKSAEYFGLEYKLDHYIATYQKPYIAFMDGITMGGGVGLSIHAPFRIATEKTVFAMPETTIGFFPDVGASFFLPRMNGAVGTYLALTSERLTGPNVFYHGIATHYLHSSSLPDLEARLAELRFKDGDDLPTRLSLINETLEEFCTGLPYDQPMRMSGKIRQAIDRCFNKNNVNDIIAALETETGQTAGWAKQQLEVLHKRSPTSVHVTLRQMRTGGEWDMAETFQKEYQIASKFMQHPDFTEGVTALLVRKEAPKWQPESLEAIASAGSNVAKPFFEFNKEDGLELFTKRTFSEYPYQALGVPTEKEIQKMLSDRTYKPDQLAQAVIASRKGRQGVSDVVNEILKRKTEVDGKGNVRWVADESPSTSKI